MQLLAILQWDPDRIFFIVPYLNLPIYWYGFLFALGYEIAWLLVKKSLSEFLYDPHQSSTDHLKCVSQVMSTLTIWGMLASVVGARLFYVLFYGLPYYLARPLDIFNLRQGGLASHGAMLGLLITFYCISHGYRKKYPRLTPVALLDMLAIAVGFAGCCIRIGNFINQEVTGVASSLPWAVEFLHSADGTVGPVHPVQLYEAICYCLISLALVLLWRKHKRWVGSGLFLALGLVAITSCRFALEFFKVPQGAVLPLFWGLRMGQLLSLPFLMLGIFLLYKAKGQLKTSRTEGEMASSL